jgi:hypothetical protein
MEREQHQSKTDCYTAEVFYPGSGTGAEGKKASNEKYGRGSRYVERENLNNQATFAPSIMASAGTRPTSPSAVKEAAIRPVAVLL